MTRSLIAAEMTQTSVHDAFEYIIQLQFKGYSSHLSKNKGVICFRYEVIFLFEKMKTYRVSDVIFVFLNHIHRSNSICKSSVNIV